MPWMVSTHVPKLAEHARRAGIIVRPVAGYGLDDCLRVTIGSAEEMASLSTELERIVGGDRESGGLMVGGA